MGSLVLDRLPGRSIQNGKVLALEEPEQFLFQEMQKQILVYKEPEQFLFQEVGNQICKVLERSGSGTQVLDSELALVEKR